MLRRRCFLRHRRREDFNHCEICGAPLKWIFTGIEWVPCDEAPTLVYLGHGEQQALYKKDWVRCGLYDGLHDGVLPVYAHIPHALSCNCYGEKRGVNSEQAL